MNSYSNYLLRLKVWLIENKLPSLEYTQDYKNRMRFRATMSVTKDGSSGTFVCRISFIFSKWKRSFLDILGTFGNKIAFIDAKLIFYVDSGRFCKLWAGKQKWASAGYERRPAQRYACGRHPGHPGNTRQDDIAGQQRGAADRSTETTGGLTVKIQVVLWAEPSKLQTLCVNYCHSSVFF